MYHIIVNPVAGHGSGLPFIPRIEQAMRSHGKDCTVLYTHAPHDAERMAREACASHTEGILSMGGDGTLQEIVSGLYAFERDTSPFAIQTPLGVLPCGSGNDFQLSTRVGSSGKKCDIAQTLARCLDSVFNHQTRKIDLVRVGDTAFINIANIGLDAHIVKDADKLKKTFGRSAYLLASFAGILKHKNIKMDIEVNGEKRSGSYTLIAVCNGQYYGGGMRIAPHASIDDGQLTVCLIHAMRRSKTLCLFPTLLMERHMQLKEVEYVQCSQISITPEQPTLLCLDGNLSVSTGAIAFTVLPRALSMFLTA